MFCYKIAGLFECCYFPVDTGHKLNIHETFRRRPGRLLNDLFTFNLRPVSTGFKSAITSKLPVLSLETRSLMNSSIYQNQNRWTFVMRCAIWYHLYNLKNVKNTHGGVLILVKLQASAFSHSYSSNQSIIKYFPVNFFYK